MFEVIKRKLSSRKFWLAIIGFVTALMISFNAPPDSITNITTTISAFSTIVIYIVGESLTDTKRGN